MRKNMKNVWAIVWVYVLCSALNGCCAYDNKEYPMESWFIKPTTMIDEGQFKQTAEPLRVLLTVNYKKNERPVITDPFADRSPDWREQHGLWLASKCYLERTGLFKIVEIEAENIQGRIIVNIARKMNEKTKALIVQKEDNAYRDKIVYEYDMIMDMAVEMKGKPVLIAVPQTNRMVVGHENSKEKGYHIEKFTFSYFNTMGFHTEFVHRFYKQMLFESVKQIENDLF